MVQLSVPWLKRLYLGKEALRGLMEEEGERAQPRQAPLWRFLPQACLFQPPPVVLQPLSFPLNSPGPLLTPSIFWCQEAAHKQAATRSVPAAGISSGRHRNRPRTRKDLKTNLKAIYLKFPWLYLNKPVTHIQHTLIKISKWFKLFQRMLIQYSC